jgi:hypothetical protein
MVPPFSGSKSVELGYVGKVNPQSHWLILCQRGHKYMCAASKSTKRL